MKKGELLESKEGPGQERFILRLYRKQKERAGYSRLRGTRAGLYQSEVKIILDITIYNPKEVRAAV